MHGTGSVAAGCRPLALLALTLLLGCGGGQENPAESRLAGVAALYSKYQIANRGQMPADEQAFHAFVDSYSDIDVILDRAGVNSAETLFISERDGQPFVLLFGSDLSRFEGGVVAYEQTPAGDRRRVAYRAGFAGELAEADFQEMQSGS